MSTITRRDPLQYLAQELDTMRSQGIYRRLRILEDEQKAHANFDHRSVVNLSSNNYLGLTTHPRLKRRALEAIEQFGVGSGSVRTIAGTMAIHMELERRLAEFKKTEAVVVFQSGFTANAGTVSSVLSKDDVDHLRRAQSREHHRRQPPEPRDNQSVSAQGRRRRARILRDCRPDQRKLLITDGVFSMDGDLGPLPDLCALAEEYGCIMMVDDAHASGVFGANGRGTIDHFGVHGRVDIQVGTLSKAIGALGGYVAGSRSSLIDFLYHRARPFLFSTSHPPSVAATCTRRARTSCSKNRDHRASVEEHALLQSRTGRARLQHGDQRKPTINTRVEAERDQSCFEEARVLPQTLDNLPVL